MLPYWVIYLFSALPALAGGGRFGERRSWIAWLPVAIILTAFVGLRYEVGTDWLNYVTIFDRLRWMDVVSAVREVDPAFGILNWLVNALGIDFWLVNLVCAAIFVWGLIAFIMRLANPWLALAVATPYLVIVVGMGYTRQAAALGLLMIGIRSVSDRSLSYFVFWTLLAATFHKSAVIILPIGGIAFARNKLLAGILLPLIGTAMYYLFLSNTLADTLSSYAINNVESQGALIRVLMNVPPAAIYIMLRGRFDFPPREATLWLGFSIAALVSLPVLELLESTTITDRLAVYLIPLQLVVLSSLPDAISRTAVSRRQIALLVLLYGALIQLVWLGFAAHAADWVPYRFYPILQDFA